MLWDFSFGVLVVEVSTANLNQFCNLWDSAAIGSFVCFRDMWLWEAGSK